MAKPTTEPSPAPSREMLDKWAQHLPERQSIMEFWEWLEKNALFKREIVDLNIEQLLDEYHQIDRKQLEQERRAALERHRQFAETVAKKK